MSSSSTLPPIQQQQQPCGCGTFILNNGLVETVLPRCAVPYFDPVTGQLKKNTPQDWFLAAVRANTNNKVKQPLSSSSISSSSSSSSSLGTMAMLRRIFQTEGFTGLYAGLAPTLVMGVPNTVLYFVSYEELKEQLLILSSSSSSSKQQQQSSTSTSTSWSYFIPALAGAGARVVASLATAPLELIRTRQAARVGGSGATTSTSTTTSTNASGGGVWHEALLIVKESGGSLRGLYAGVSPTLLRDVPFSAIYWMGLENLRHNATLHQWYDNNNNNNNSNGGEATTSFYHVPALVQDLIHGSVAGMVAAACTTPLDVLKTRQQVARMNMVANTTTTTTTPATTTTTTTISSWKLAQQIIQTEGFGTGLWRGNTTRMIKVAPACAIMIASYEWGKRELGDLIE
jgi:solute carrier family 25, member 39/40